jgi:mono/diheme cytochrome c family protein
MRPVIALAVAAALVAGGPAVAQFNDPAHFRQQDGAALYRDICQGCHMPNGKGAAGAGAYPALAGNEKLGAAGYPVLVVMNGQKAMPGFAGMLSDAQIAAVVNYVRTHFGNHYRDAVTAADVKTARP